jgi:hypothetical protein
LKRIKFNCTQSKFRLKTIIQNTILNPNWSTKKILRMSEYHKQINNAVGIILRHVKSPSNEISLNKNNILTCFNLQINLDSYCIREFNFNSKLRVMVYLYSKFFNRVKICNKMEDFFSFIDLKTQQETFDFLLKRFYF